MTDSPKKEKKITEENSVPVQMNNQELKFPVTYRLKAVMTVALNDAENKQKLIDIFKKLDIGYLYQSKNKSNKGAYVSFTYEVTLNDRQTMNRLYVLLKEIENLKFAL